MQMMQMKLKLAIVGTGKSQRQVAAETERLTENRLSEIVCGWIEPRAERKKPWRACSANRSSCSSRNLRSGRKGNSASGAGHPDKARGLMTC